MWQHPQGKAGGAGTLGWGSASRFAPHSFGVLRLAGGCGVVGLREMFQNLSWRLNISVRISRSVEAVLSTPGAVSGAV